MVNDLIRRDPKSRRHLRIRIELFSVLAVVAIAVVLFLVNVNSNLNGTLGSANSKITTESGTVGLLNQSVQNLTNTLNAKISAFSVNTSKDSQLISTLENQISSFKVNMSSLVSNYAFLQSSYKSLQLSINSMLSRISVKNGVIGNLTNTVANLETPKNTSASSFFLLNNPMSSFVWFGTNPGSNSSGKVNSWRESSAYNTTWAMCPINFTTSTQCPLKGWLGNQPAGMIFQFLNKNTIATNFLVYSLENGPNNQSGMSDPGYMMFTKTANNGNIQVWTGSAITGSAMDNNTVFGYVNFTGTLYFNGTPSGSSLINGTLIQYGYSYPKWNKAFPYYFPNTVEVGNGDYLGIVSLNYLSSVDLSSTQLEALVNATKFPVIATYNGSKI
ncbi:MAG: hypothetical protein M1433_02970 [Candidatus Parvarchaeota archaeon]|nr:hypothetical protein [Candidatus Parvarchaeota archaeon]